MNKQPGLLLLIVMSVLLSGNCVAAPVMKEGLWEITSKMEMPGMPMQMPAQSYKHCMTTDNMVPQQQSPNQDCKMISNNVRGNTVTWKMECKTPQGPTIMDGKVTYNNDSMNGVIKMKQSGMDMTQRMSGRYLGKCQ